MITFEKLWITMRKKEISQYRLVKEHGIDYAQLHRLRHNMVVKTSILDRLCIILDCGIQDIMEAVPDKENR